MDAQSLTPALPVFTAPSFPAQLSSYGIYAQPPSAGFPSVTPFQRKNITNIATFQLNVIGALLPRNRNYSIRPGDDCTIVMNFIDPNGGTIDLTNARIVWTLLDYDASVAVGPVTLTGLTTDGTATLTITAAVTGTLAPGRYTDFARIVFADGNVSYSIEPGTVLVGADPLNP